MWEALRGAFGTSFLFPQLLFFFLGKSFLLVGTCVYVCVHVHTYMYLHASVYVCEHTYVCTCICVHMCMYVFICVCIHLCVCACTCVCVCVCIGQEWQFVNFNLVKWESEGCRTGFKDIPTHVIIGNSCFSLSLYFLIYKLRFTMSKLDTTCGVGTVRVLGAYMGQLCKVSRIMQMSFLLSFIHLRHTFWVFLPGPLFWGIYVFLRETKT